MNKQHEKPKHLNSYFSINNNCLQNIFIQFGHLVNTYFVKHLAVKINKLAEQG